MDGGVGSLVSLSASRRRLRLIQNRHWSRRGAYYFYNTVTNEVTWQNPLESEGNAEGSTSAAAAAPQEDQGPDLGGIDPELAFLDPTLSRQMTSGGGATPAFQARFNSRTGRFQVSGDGSELSKCITDLSSSSSPSPRRSCFRRETPQ